MSEYQLASKGGLKLKASSKSSIKKKKSKKDEKKFMEKMSTVNSDELVEAGLQKKSQPTKTRAELAFERQREKNDLKRIMEKAGKTHKQRVEDFNKHLDNLSEHYDIPKVSWTK